MNTARQIEEFYSMDSARASNGRRPPQAAFRQKLARRRAEPPEPPTARTATGAAHPHQKEDSSMKDMDIQTKLDGLDEDAQRQVEAATSRLFDDWQAVYHEEPGEEARRVILSLAVGQYMRSAEAVPS